MRSAPRASYSHRANNPTSLLFFPPRAYAYREQKEKQDAKERYWKVGRVLSALVFLRPSVLRIPY